MDFSSATIALPARSRPRAAMPSIIRSMLPRKALNAISALQGAATPAPPAVRVTDRAILGRIEEGEEYRQGQVQGGLVGAEDLGGRQDQVAPIGDVSGSGDFGSG